MSKTIKTSVSFNREKEENWDLEEQAEQLNFKSPSDLLYVGYNVDCNVEIYEEVDNEGKTHVMCRVLSIQGVDVSDKEIYI